MFTGNEVGQMQKYLKKIADGEKIEYFSTPPIVDPEWPEVYPLFERLADYAVNKIRVC